MNGANLTQSLWLFAVHSCNPDLIHLLEEDKVEKEDNSFDTILIESIKCHHNEFTNYFLDISQTNIEKFTSKLLKYYNFEFIQKENINKKTFYDLCKNDYFDLVQYFLPSIENINEITDSTIKYKKEKSKNSPKFLIQQKTPLIIAVEKENVEIVKLLLTAKNIDVNIYWKSKYNNRHKVNIKSILHIAVENENIEIVKLLLSNQTIKVNRLYDIFVPDENCIYKKTALHIAVENENTEIVSLLLNVNNIDVNKLEIKEKLDRTNSKEKKTALFIAVEKRNIDIINLLCRDIDLDMNIPYKLSNASIEQTRIPKRIGIVQKTPLQLAQQMEDKTIYQTLQKNYRDIFSLKKY